MRALAAALAASLLAGCAGLAEQASQEQRVSDLAINALQVGKTRREDVRQRFGEPRSVTEFPRQQREAWEYRYLAYGTSGPRMILYAQFSPDGVLRELIRLDNMSNYGTGGSGPSW